MEIVISIAAKIAEYSVAPIGRSVGYLIYYNRNVKTLEAEVENLGDIKNGVQLLVDAAKRNLDVIEPQVERWLTAVNVLNEEVETFLEGEVEINKNGWCSDPISRYSLSRKAKKKTRAITELKGKVPFPRISYPAPPLGIEQMAPTGDFVDCESRKFIMDDIIAALKDDNINAIGICGLGGVGKTTTVKKVEKRAKLEKLFDEVVMAVVTQTPNLIGIQDEIAEKLGLKLEEKSLSGRADKLRERLLKCGRSLVILDDVWETLELEKIGIPCGRDHKGCKLVMTSRSQGVCIAMGTCQLFTIGVLLKQEAWSLFKDKAGDSIESPDLHQIATEVIEECGGLPIAIVTLGTVLKAQTVGMELKDKPALWKDALLQLRQAIPENIPEMYKKVYQSLELSFNVLSPQAKSCLLLCCIFKEDDNIPLQDLVRCGMGLDLFEGVEEMIQATNRVRALVQNLKSCYLLLDSEKEECVKMHDVVRDVIRLIATTDKHALMLRHGLELKKWPTESRDELYTSISLISNKIQELLLLESKESSTGIFLDRLSTEMPDNLFEGMKELRVLELRRMFIPSPPSSLSLLTKLRTLCIQDCNLENISFIGELKMLMILSFRGSSIQELPREIGKLTHLQSLDLTGCRDLKRISPGVLSSLIRLEQLCMRCKFVSREVDEEGTSERNNVELAELKSLSDHLTTLEIDNLPRSAKFLGGFKKLERFWIQIGGSLASSVSGVDYEYKHVGNELIINLDSRIPDESWINEVLKKTETLLFRVCGVKNVVNNVNQESHVRLKLLKILSCDVLEYVFDTADLIPQSIFPILKLLYIYEAENMKVICRGQLPAGSFAELRCISLERCKILENVFSESMARGLVQLKQLDIISCEMMEEIVVMERGAEEKVITSKIRFPKLSELRFVNLPSLVGFSKKMGEIEFPQLGYLKLIGLPKLRSLFPSSTVGSEGNDEYDDSATQHLLNQKIKSLCELRSVTVLRCEKLLNVFSPDSIQSLLNLEEVKIKECDSVEVALDFVGMNIEEGGAALPLSRLKRLELSNLPNLICVWKKLPQRILDCQNLQSLIIVRCPALKNIFSLSTAKIAEQLQELEIGECKMMTEILAEDEGDEKGMDKVEFLQLRHLRLSLLPNLRSFFPKDAGSVENHLFNGKVSFPRLEKLEIAYMENFGEIWCSQLPSDSFCELRVLRFFFCDKILQVAPFHLLTRLHNLEEVLAMSCNSLEEVFEFKCPNVEEGHAVMLPGSLKHTSLNSLKKLQVWDCANLRNLFHPSVTRGLVHLQELYISNCVMMEEIVTKGEEPEKGTMDKIVLPQLKSLTLSCLQNLTSFCQGLYAFDLPSLDFFHVDGCPKMSTFSLGFASTPKLKGVDVGNYFQVYLRGRDLNNIIPELFQTQDLEVNQATVQQENDVRRDQSPN